MKYLEISGTYYDFGFQIGKYFKRYLNKIIEPYREKIKVKKVNKYVNLLENKLEKLFPNCLEEIYGRADGAKIERKTMLLLFFPEIFKNIDGCTTIIVKQQDNFLFAHNEDGKSTPENTVLVKFENKSKFLIALVTAERLAGFAFSFNSDGMIFSCNHIAGSKINIKNISRYIMIREILECEDISSTIAKMKKFKVASAFNLNVLDLKSAQAVCIEKDIKKIYLKQVNSSFARANHFIIKKHKYKTLSPSTKFRQEKVTELTNGLDLNTCRIEDLHNILKFETADYNKSIFKDCHKYPQKSHTLCTFLFNSKDNKIKIIDNYTNETLCFDLSGKKIMP